MKNKKIWLVLLVIVLAFGMTACPTDAGGSGSGSGGDSDSSTTYRYSDAEGNTYELLITSESTAAYKLGKSDNYVLHSADEGNAYELLITSADRAVYKPTKGDNYVLTITFKDGKVEKSTGTVKEFKDGQFQLKSSDNKEFQVIVKGNNIAEIDGDIPVELPAAKRLTITGFTTWQGKPANNGGAYYHLYGVFLIADPDNLYDEWFPIVDALWYETVESNGSAGNVNFDLIIPVYNTWNFGRMPWTGTGSYYVVIVPCVSPNFYSDEAKIYKTSGSPDKVYITSQSTTLEFSKFGDFGD